MVKIKNGVYDMIIFLLVLIWYIIGFVGGTYVWHNKMKIDFNMFYWIFIPLISIFGPVSVISGYITYITNGGSEYFTRS